ncbi:hypothetical protein [Rhodopirellula halodulae]|uniref:hypothetical protein n=1 Tax=Rhodopirellula halodulae TaxID=2894198 RepID=UPI001E327719|nr:hypothetical protein [Rhodopirellula sp. JC737]MCC9656737.1 hypothetical protein [Rhodopirellula sp. JC737]
MPLTKLLPLVYLAMPAAVWTANALLGKRRLHWVLAFFAACLIAYITLIVSVQVISFELELELYEYDLDGDGSFSESEMTADAERAMDAVTSDTGRAFAPITGIPITFVWATICFLTCSAIRWTGRMLFSIVTRGTSTESEAVFPDTVPAALESGNPYQPPATGKSG